MAHSMLPSSTTSGSQLAFGQSLFLNVLAFGTLWRLLLLYNSGSAISMRNSLVLVAVGVNLLLPACIENMMAASAHTGTSHTLLCVLLVSYYCWIAGR
jgi:hypothetical protein